MNGNAMPVAPPGQEVEVLRFGSRGVVNPHEAILDEISRCSTQVAFYQAKLNEAPADESILEEYRPWLNLWMKERDRLTRICSEAIKIGLSERMVRLEERRAELVARVLMATIEELDLPPELAARAPAILRRQLMALDSGV